MIYIYVHIATLGGYKDIINELFDRINKSGLNNISQINLHCCGDRLSSFNNKSVQYNGLLDTYEFPTLEAMKNKANEDPDGKFLYLHTKGASTSNNECINDWRKYMSYFVIDKYENCLSLLDSYSSCGVDLRSEPCLHYSGNFWWARGQHLITLPNFSDMPIVLTERHKAEFWVCSRGTNHYGMWESNIPSNERHLHRYLKNNYE